MENTIINAIVYIDLDSEEEAGPLFWYPSELSRPILRRIELKSKLLLSSDVGFIPESLLIIPFPILKKKGLIKYMERNQTGHKYLVKRTAIIFLFDESDDYLFYRYMSFIDSYFTETTSNILELEQQNADYSKIFQEMVLLRDKIFEVVEELREKSKYSPTPQAKEVFTEVDEPIKQKFKVVVLGDPGVGKTTTILRFTDNVFMRAYVPTMGLNITQKRFRMNGRPIELVLWDIGGQVRFRSIANQFYEGASAMIIIFDLTSPTTFINASKWYNDIKDYFGDKFEQIGYLFGNKTDLTEQRKVSRIDAERLATALDLRYLETSALTGDQIENSFQEIADALLNSFYKDIF